MGGEREPGYEAKIRAVAGKGSGPTFCVGDCFQSFSELELRGKAAGQKFSTHTHSLSLKTAHTSKQVSTYCHSERLEVMLCTLEY